MLMDDTVKQHDEVHAVVLLRLDGSAIQRPRVQKSHSSFLTSSSTTHRTISFADDHATYPRPFHIRMVCYTTFLLLSPNWVFAYCAICLSHCWLPSFLYGIDIVLRFGRMFLWCVVCWGSTWSLFLPSPVLHLLVPFLSSLSSCRRFCHFSNSNDNIFSEYSMRMIHEYTTAEKK